MWQKLETLEGALIRRFLIYQGSSFQYSRNDGSRSMSRKRLEPGVDIFIYQISEGSSSVSQVSEP